jgi:hypothetical protein
MIDRNADALEWALLRFKLNEAREHLDILIKDMDTNPEFGEIEFGIDLAHIYAHLNQAWNGRGKKGEWSESDFDLFSQYPSRLEPDGTWPPLDEDD